MLQRTLPVVVLETNLNLLIFVMTTKNERIENHAAQSATWSAF